MASHHAPLLERYEVVQLKPIHEMTEQDRAAMPALVASLDVFLFQEIGPSMHPADTAHLMQFLSGRAISFPSMWFAGHLPDMVYFRDEAGSKICGADYVYHSLVIAACYLNELSVSQAVDFFLDPEAIDPAYLLANYRAGLDELRRREVNCEITITDMIDEKGPSWRGFHVMNHPCGDLLGHVFNQALTLLDVAPMEHSGDPLSYMRWPISGAVKRAFGTPGPAEFVGSEGPVPLREMVAGFYAIYDRNPEILAHNRDVIDASPLIRACRFTHASGDVSRETRNHGGR